MSKLIIFISFLFVIPWAILASKTVNAANPSCTVLPMSISTTEQATATLTLNFTPSANRNYSILVRKGSTDIVTKTFTVNDSGVGSTTLGPFSDSGTYNWQMWGPGVANCASSFSVDANFGQANCPQFLSWSSPIIKNQPFKANFEPAFAPLGPASKYIVVINREFSDPTKRANLSPTAAIGPGWAASFSGLNKGTYSAGLYYDPSGIPSSSSRQCATLSSINITDATGGTGTGLTGDNPCAGGTCNTALGPISTNPTAFAGKILSIGIGIAGGIALILMVIGSIRVVISRGDPKNVAVGREMIIAAIFGLLFLIFSILILKFIGAQILPTNPFV